MFLTKRDNSIVKNIILGLCTALFFSASLYLEYFNIINLLLNSICAIVAIYLLLTIPKKASFFAGFFIGSFWFYWVSYSFYYYELSYLIPLVVLGLALAYGAIFYLVGFFENLYYRAIALFLLSYLSLFNFDWLKLELLLVDTYFFTQKAYLALFIGSIFMFCMLRRFKFLALIPLLLCVDIHIKKDNSFDESISMPAFNLDQEQKWKRENLEKIVRENLEKINDAIKDKKTLVILPETAFPMVLNESSFLMDILKKTSLKIDILTGALQRKDGLFYNSTYFFSKGELQIANKVVLVPFGEAVPLPQKIREFINDSFYNGAKDYERAKSPTDFTIGEKKYRNAICYEATNEEIFRNLNGVKNMIVISNLAWFTPSVMPSLQKRLMKYYAKKYGVTIYHVANGSENFVVKY